MGTPTLEARNARTGAVIAEDVRVTQGMWDRMRGLLAYPPLAPGEGLLIAPCNGIHTVGMGYPIDVVFVDRAGRVLRTAEAMPPLHFIPWVRRAHAVLELPAGMLGATGTLVGDTVQFEGPEATS